MASGLSKLLLRLEVVADDGKFPSSVHKVLFNDDLLIEILLRLPILSLHLFKRVCKQWQSIITSPSFTLTRTRIPTVDPPSGLFIPRWSQNSNKYDHDFVSFDPRIPTKRSIEPLVCLGGWIEDSCNGLLLCNIGYDKYYVCNPSICMFKMLPPKHDLYYERNSYEEMMIAFDPIKSPFYKVVHVGTAACDVDCHYLIQTYSSETGVWRVSDDKFESDLFFDFSDGVYWNGAIHWLDYDEPFLVKLDIEEDPVLTQIQTPLPLTVEGLVHSDQKLFKSDGSLLLLCKDRDCSRHLKIYEMKNEYFVWSVKYSVNLDFMMRPYPIWRARIDWRCRDVLSIVLGERDKDSFMVIQESGKILQYKFVLEKTSELFDLGKADSRSDYYFGYIASFAHA